MGISLNGLTPAGTYPGLIKTGDNTAISGTPKVLSDGNGNNLPMEVSTTGVNLTGSPTVNSVAIANTTQLATKQDTLVSGTNIKTINGTSVLGSGNIAVVTSPSGVSGAIQFSNGSAFASDAANFFWDDTNNRLGVGTNAPTATTHIKGSGSTSATTSLLVQNSAGSNLLRTFDNGVTKLGGLGTFGKLDFGVTPNDSTLAHIQLLSNLILEFKEFNGSGMRFADGFGKFPLFLSDGKASVNKNAIAEASAQFEVVSTTGGFLPPRMTNSQRTSISSPAVGLMVYCTDAVEGLYINKSTGWTLVI